MSVLESLGMGPSRFQPDPKYKYEDNLQYVLDQQFLALLVGLVALLLPFAMLIGVLLRLLNLPFGTCFYDSISHFYFSQLFGDVLVAALAGIGTFLIAYRGESRRESLFATIAGFGAFGIALFPTTERGCELTRFSGRVLADLEELPGEPLSVVQPNDPEQFFELFQNVEKVHFASAALLFLFLAYYSFFIFTRVIDEQHRDPQRRLTAVKKTRNRIYIASGVVILISIAAIAAKALAGEAWPWWKTYNLTFWFEAFALWAFGVSWMVKGRFWGMLLLDPRDIRRPATAAA